ncbi:flagellar protein fliS [Collimonas arenae]|nr:flagellar protein fliS [Collimonas arenae]
MSASPQQLVTMLFDGAKAAIGMARHHMANGDISAKGNAISKAVSIIDSGLKASLDPDSGGRLAPNWQQICRRYTTTSASA